MKKYTSVDVYIASFPEWEDKLRLLRSIVLKNTAFEKLSNYRQKEYVEYIIPFTN